MSPIGDTLTASNAESKKIVILGCGVIGLTTAVHLAKKYPQYSIAIIARDMPGDYHIDYASPWAGADYLPSAFESRDRILELKTWPYLERLARDEPGAAIHFQPTRIYTRTGDPPKEPDFIRQMPAFRHLEKHELPHGHSSGVSFTSVVINTAIYLPWLVSQCLELGVTLQREIVAHISECAAMHPSGAADLVINCSGIGSLRLGGVSDTMLYPARGQVIIARNNSSYTISTSSTSDGEEEKCYIMQRAGGGGIVIGGCRQANNADASVDHDLAARMSQRALAICPSIASGHAGGTLDVVRHAVGLRPCRHGGIRLEVGSCEGGPVIHCYGHGGYGYQSSWGSAEEVGTLVAKI